MARVSANRDLPQVACMVSSPTLPLGSWVWVYGVRTDTLLRCRVTDVSQPRDKARHLRMGRLVELAYEVTAQLCGSTRERVVDCPIVTVELR